MLRMLRGESVDALSRELGVPIVRLEEWRDQAEGRRTPVRAVPSSARDARSAQNDPVEKQLDDANRRIGELVMEAEILRKEREARRPLGGRRSPNGKMPAEEFFGRHLLGKPRQFMPG